MEPAVPTIDMEELPFVIFYQCRMCTHLFFDDVEKMFLHLEERHGAMLDCEELKTLVYTNGLKLGPPPPSGSSDAATEELEQQTNVNKDEDELGLIDDDDEDDPAQLVIPEIVHGQTEDEDFVDNGVYDDDEAAYQEENGDHELQDVKYHFKMHDDEEQLPEGDFEKKLSVIGNNGSEELYDSNDDDDTQNPEELETIPQGYNYDQGDYEDYDEDNSAEPSLEGVEFEDYGEGDELGEEEQDEDLENDDGTYSSDNGSQQKGQLVNYGYSCKFCGKFFTTQRGLQSHEQHHKIQATQPALRTNQARRFPCKLCKSKTFSSFKDLKQHIKSHTSERIHVCKFCFSTFNNTASLTKHLTIHQRENPHKCFCGKSFVSANTLKIHRKIHTGIKPFVCNYFQCGRAFVTKSTLESHLRTHTGEKPYACQLCESSFTTSSAKYRHERHVHKAHT